MTSAVTISRMDDHKKKPGRPKKDRSQDRHLPHRLLRLPAELYARLEKLAERNDRPVSREGRRAILRYLEQEEKQIKPNE